MVTKAKTNTKKVDLTPTPIDDNASWTRESAIRMAIDLFKQPYFSKEANVTSIVAVADTFATFILEGKAAALPEVVEAVQS